jgi:LacI family transcriptional regulator
MDSRRRKQPVTVYDIALKADVSPATVSRVLQGSRFVSAAKRAAVLSAADALRYRPNVMAQDLASGRSRTVGMVLPDTACSFWGRFIHGAEATLHEAGYHLLLASAEGVEGEERAVELLLSHQVDGLVVGGGAIPEERFEALVGETPAAVVFRGPAGLQPRRVLVDNRDGARQAMRHLLDLGHEQIAHVAGPADHGDAIERRRGYEDALRQAGIELDPGLVAGGNFRAAQGHACMRDLLEARPGLTAVFAASDQMALGAIRALDEAGLHTPRDVSVVGFDDEAFTEYCVPSLTSVSQPIDAIGRAAVEVVLGQVRGEPIPQPGFETRLRVRESTGVVARRTRRKLLASAGR